MKHTIDGLMYCIKALRTIEAHSRPMPWAADVDEAVKQQEAAVRAYAEAMLSEAAPQWMPWQGGMTNAELRAAWKDKLPKVTPTDQELTAFALGVEVGQSINLAPLPHSKTKGN